MANKMKETDRIRGAHLTPAVDKNTFGRSSNRAFGELLTTADEDLRVIASNIRLTNSKFGSPLRAYPQDISRFSMHIWTGTMTAHAASNTRFEDSAVIIDDSELEKRAGTRLFIRFLEKGSGLTYLFPLPVDHLGKTNAILVAEHPDYTLIHDGDRRILLPSEGRTLASMVGLVENFPVYEGASGSLVYCEEKHGIPVSSGGYRWYEEIILVRSEQEHIGPIVRTYYNYGRNSINLTMLGTQKLDSFYETPRSPIRRTTSNLPSGYQGYRPNSVVFYEEA
jgi:hypothetical protein